MKHQKLILPFLLCTVPTLQPALASDACVRTVARILSDSKLSASVNEAIVSSEKILGHTLTTKQQASLEKAVDLASGEIYTPSELTQQNKILRKGGFSEPEIEKLRKGGVLGNSVLSLVNGSPSGVDFVNLPLQDLNSRVIKELRNGDSYHYLVGEHGNIYATKNSLDFAADRLVVATSAETGTIGDPTTFVVREAGEITFDRGTKNFNFKPKYGFDHNSDDAKDLISRVRETNPETAISYQANPAIPPSRVLKCLDLVSAQAGGKNFVLDRMLTDNAVTTIAVGSSELAGAGRLKTAEGREIIESDIVGGNVNGLIGAAVGKRLVIQNSGFITSMGVRTGMGLGMIEVQKNITKTMVGSDAKGNSAADIAAFNRAHFFARLPVNHAIDQFMVKSLPNMVFNTCQKYPTLSLAVGPKAVRFYERYASSTIYYGLRQTIVGH